MADTTPLQEERVEAQRARIQNKMQSRDGPNESAVGTSNGMSSRSAAEQKALDTRYEMSAVNYASVTAATNVRVAAEVAESQRRQRAQDVQRQICELQESSGADAQHGALNLQFEALYRLGVPHELHSALTEQRAECDALIGVKDKLLEELREQLHQREEEYVGLLRKNKDEVGRLVDTMRTSTDDYLHQYTVKLQSIEKTYEAERRAYLDRCAEEVKELVKTRRTKEVEYRKRREQKLAEAQQQLEERYESGYEDFNEAKREHQSDVHALREELEKSKADYLLNGERLTYNLQVLRERVKESRSAQAQYKKKIARLQETLATLLARYQDAEKRFQRANNELATQLHRVDQQYTDTQGKFATFEKKDKAKYRQLWKLHHDKCQALAQECLQADRVVYEELLQMPWQPPALRYWPREEMGVEAQKDEMDDRPEEAPEVELTEAAQMLFSILKSQASFLVDGNVRDAIQAVEGATQEQADVEGILTTLQLHRTSDVEDMLEYFLVENEDETVALINPQEALKALQAYLSHRAAEDGKAKSSSGTERTQTAAGEARAAEKQRAAEREYWRNMAATVPKDHLQVWEALEDGLSQYLAQLQQRKQLIGATDTMRAQNKELRDLVQQYMNSAINYELYAPPRLVTEAASYLAPPP
ncbi:Sperm tail/Sperm tail C-terminal domain containing protein [Novymonas esmeraldas]|uniref:Sperm tail/Sperm tail C-terminal domain containing protein n=1 Tax=Novymonas esmeraldas TaxID=1808958 RepID=A0AAW0FB44_9TRYP